MEYVAGRIRRAQEILERRIAIENISYYAAPGQEMAEIDFLKAVLAEAEAIHRGVPLPSAPSSHEEDDVFALMDAFHGLTAARVRVRQLPSTQAIVPAGGALVWDLHKGQLHTAAPALNLTQAAAAGFQDKGAGFDVWFQCFEKPAARLQFAAKAGDLR